MQYFLTDLNNIKNFEGILEVGRISFKHFYSEEKIRERLKDRRYWIQIAKDENRRNRIVGFNIWYEDDDKEAYSWLDAVHPTHRRRGIATDLFIMQFDLAKSLGFSKVKLKTHEGHPEMINLCRKLGFRETGRDPNHWGRGLDAIFFEYSLK